MTNSNKAAAMAKVWTDRKNWAMAPVCCGCGERLEIAKNPEQQRLFCQGHDGRLHKLLRQVLRGEAARQDLPLAARANLARIGFVQKDREILNLRQPRPAGQPAAQITALMPPAPARTANRVPAK